MDCLGGHRAQLTAALPRALQAASEKQEDRRVGQLGLFEGAASSEASPARDAAAEALPEVQPWPETEKLKFEKEVLDFYFSSHPLAQLEKDFRRYAAHKVEDARTLPPDTDMVLGGMLTQVRVMPYKKPQRNGNTRFGRCKVEDFTGALECIMWGDEYTKFKDCFVADVPVIVHGKLEKKGAEPSLQITRLVRLEDARRELARELHLLFRLGQRRPVDVDVLAGILRKEPGNCPVVLTVMDQAGRRCILKLGRDFHINPARFPEDELEALLGPGSVKLR
jgi:DNA polymerase-3 subunit alpha